MKRVVVDCDGAIVPQVALDPEVPIRRSLNHRGQSANVNLQIQTPATVLLAGIDGRAGDLVRIASYVYAADQSVSRGGEADVYGDGWRRHFVVYIPVADLEFWTQEPVSQALSDALGFVSGDVWNFQFSQAVPEQRQLTLDIDPSQIFGEPDGVYLFSGGLDSLSAVLEGAVQHGKKPLLVSHSPAFNIAGRQRNLAKAVRDRFQQMWSFPLIRVAIHRTGSDPSDYSQRTRSFLFASLSSAVANLVGLADVFLADNGVVSLNLPINGQLVGAKASRSTHPKFLKLFNQLVGMVFPGGPTVKNPLWDRTRSETLKVINGHRFDSPSRGDQFLLAQAGTEPGCRPIAEYVHSASIVDLPRLPLGCLNTIHRRGIAKTSSGKNWDRAMTEPWPCPTLGSPKA